MNKNEFSDRPRYGQVVIEWIRDWPKRVQNLVLAESLISSQNLLDQTEPRIEIDDQTLWLTLLDTENVTLIKQWIRFSFALKDASSLDCEENLIFKSKLTQDMLDLLYSSRYFSSESKEVVLNYAAKFNVYCTQEKSNFSLYTLRLSSSGAVFDFEAFKQRDDSFHLKVILNYVNRKNLVPFDFLWSYLNFYNSVSEENSAQSLLAHSQLIEINSSKSIRMMLAFRQNLRLTNLDPANFFSNICTKNFEFYLNQVDNLQISNLFTHKYKEHHLVALAMSLYFDVNIFG